MMTLLIIEVRKTNLLHKQANMQEVDITFLYNK